MLELHDHPPSRCVVNDCTSPPAKRSVMCASHWAMVSPMTKGQLGMKARALRRGDQRAGNGYSANLEEAIYEARGREKKLIGCTRSV
jgi:hypothetical protein